MKIRFYGVRGSIPVCNSEFQRYGGNTTCIAIIRETADRIVVFDAGTGIRNLGKEMMLRKEIQNPINIFFSHFHWDHIQGFPFFAPAYNPEQQIGIDIMGSERQITNLKEIFSTIMQREYFPVELDAMGAQFKFLHLGDTDSMYGVNISAIPQHHKYPGGSYGFRMEDESVHLVICTDLEHINGIDPAIVEFARNADVLVHDGQYTSEEYKTHKGWGHSTWEQAVEVAIRANVKKLIISHHDPDHDDDFLDALEKKCQQLFPNSMLAREGLEIKV